MAVAARCLFLGAFADHPQFFRPGVFYIALQRNEKLGTSGHFLPNFYWTLIVHFSSNWLVASRSLFIFDQPQGAVVRKIAIG